MLPSVISQQVGDSIKAFLRSAFTFNSRCFEQPGGHSMLEQFLARPDALLKGPYLSAQLPFRKSTLPLDYFEHLSLPFAPHAHQALAFERLGRAQPLSTLVATGTGSGKTECFLYPLLNYCAGTRGQGIKAIIIYPMNALATDQASRFAGTVSGDPGLKGRVSVGLFVGDEGEQPNTRMTERQVITCKHTLRDNPPDILLTNYKMLDYLLMRPQDQQLWRFNTPGMLRYLVVDELHTFDGAQGTDLACLIRRLRHHVQVNANTFACVGTSATVGSELSPLLAYAGTIFDMPFNEEAVIKEDRYNTTEFLLADKVHFSRYPDAHELLTPEQAVTPVAYLNHQMRLWFGQPELELPIELDSDAGRAMRIRLAQALRQHSFLHLLLEQFHGGVVNINTLLSPLQAALGRDRDATAGLLQGFLALLAVARAGVTESPEQQRQREEKGKPRPVLPFVQLRSQLWVRELRRLVASVTGQPSLEFSDDVTVDAPVRYLPVVHCRDCHATGWGSYRHGNSNELQTDLDTFYRMFFGNHRDVTLVMLDHREHHSAGVHQLLCPVCLRLNKATVASCGHCGNEGGKEEQQLIRVLVPNLQKESQNGLQFDNRCPHCASNKGLSIMGSRAASLSAVAIQQLYGSAFNDHKKLITFSDSVQDAAHRAGFFSARTWPLMVRSQIARTLATLHKPMPLDAFADEVCRQAADLSGNPEAFVARFIAPNMHWLNDYKHLQREGGLPAHSDLPALVRDRLYWEVFSELGLRAGIGRTLERGATVALALPPTLAQQVTELHRQMVNELGELMDGVQVEGVMLLVLGMLRRLRQQGGVMHPALAGYRKSGGDTYLLTQKGRTSRYMPDMGPNTRLPAYWSIERIKQFDRLLGSKSNKSWYQRWLALCLGTGRNVFITATDDAIFHLLLTHLCKAGVIERFETKAGYGYGLVPAALLVTPEALMLGCTECTSRISVPVQQQHWWQQAPCTSAACRGHYQAVAVPPSPSWQTLEPHRVIGAEHTGLLSRSVREQTEQSFYRGDAPWSINLLSATPTLEMGIDVGDLSSVLLCSVPPAQANYLQRIGRAGRKDGNAFTLTLAEGNPHDQYFFQEPLEMMQGQVQAPGVFLDAAAILERQLTAFCMDSWVRTGIGPDAIGRRVKSMLDELESGRKTGFPWNFLAYVGQQYQPLFEDFLRVFNTLSDDSITQLQYFMWGDSGQHSLVGRIEEQLSLLLKDRKALKSRADKLKRALEQLEKRPRDQNYEQDHKELSGERDVLLALIRDINGKATLNFFTDEGLLPNYAFPEAGVTLRSVLWRKKEVVEQKDGGSAYEYTPYEYERPAANALAELAPLNSFYAGGHKVEIEQVDLKVSEPESWRLCNHCNHSECLDETGDPHKVCPCCGSPGWADAGQKTTLLKLRQVYARASERSSLITDDADSRTPGFFQRQLLVSFEPSAVTQAYQIDNPEIPFGFEFLRKVTLRDINFGQMDDQAGDLLVAGEQKKQSGFKVCLGCGMVQRHRKQEPRHDLSCKYRHEPEKARFEDYLYLYRQLESEALRILLPVSQFSTDNTTEASLAAALQLGLKRYFKGNVDHLKGVIYKEPENEGDAYRQYLVIYDTVPGGTGSLKELMRTPDNLMRLLTEALQALTDCGCNADPDKDGCYHCVYAYRDRARMRLVSRNRARRLLEAIVGARDNLKEIESVSRISLEPMMGSELEQKFLTTLKAVPGLRVVRDQVRGCAGWSVYTDDPGTSWHMLAQMPLGPEQQVALTCRPDYVLYPAREDAGLLPMTVFLDGFAFHKERVHEDVQQRQALLASGRFHVWTLGWHDLASDQCAHIKDVLGLGHQAAMKDPGRFESFHEDNFLTLSNSLQNRNSFALFTAWLQTPQATREQLTRAACGHSWVWLDVATARDPERQQKLGYEMQENAGDDQRQTLLPKEPFLFGGLLDCLGTSQQLVELAAVLPLGCLTARYETREQARQCLREQIRVHLCFDDRNMAEPGYEAALNGFWRIVNIWQCLPGLSFTSRRAVSAPLDGMTLPPLIPTPQMQGDWQQIQELELLPVHVLTLLMAARLPVPEVGYPLTSDEGDILAEADLAWPDHQLVVLTPDFAEDAPVFEAHGWCCLTGDIDEALINRIHAQIEKGNDR